jgi:UDP-N-acetylmuramoyl-tripeptide--D-alanyl-D-alanine ligase
MMQVAIRPALWTYDNAAMATAGRVIGQWTATGVSIDSRTIQPGDLFVALKGPQFDGHDYVAKALAAGAAAAMVSRRPDGLAPDAPLLIVADTLAGLNRLGQEARKRVTGKIAAVTGSVGKTSTKEALRHCLSLQGPTHASAASFNNLWGVPLSLARMLRNTRYGVFEIGMNHAGEITPLSQLVRPHVALITGVEAVHTEHFASLEAIADAKAEIFAGVVAGGTAVLNRDNSQYQRLAERAKVCGIGRIVTFGAGAEADVRLVECAVESEATAVVAAVEGRRLAYRIGASGRHWAINSLAVLAAAQALGADVASAATALSTFAPPAGRGQRRRIALPGGAAALSDKQGAQGAPGGAFELIDDSYNASPASMRAAFEALAAIAPGPRGRRIAALGDMLELGPAAAALHAELAADLQRAKVDKVFAAGPLMGHLFERLPKAMQGRHVPSAAELAGVLRAAIKPGDVVLVKGSHGSRMGGVVEALQAGAPGSALGAANG